jgi:hypothetical protein
MRTRDLKADCGLLKPIAHTQFAGSHCCKMPLLVQRRRSFARSPGRPPGQVDLRTQRDLTRNAPGARLSRLPAGPKAIIAQRTGSLDPTTYRDRYEEAQTTPQAEAISGPTVRARLLSRGAGRDQPRCCPPLPVRRTA